MASPPACYCLQLAMAQRLETLRVGFEGRLAEWQAQAAARQGAQERQVRVWSGCGCGVDLLWMG